MGHIIRLGSEGTPYPGASCDSGTAASVLPITMRRWVEAFPAQDGHADQAERALRTALLSAPGAEFALGPLEGLETLLRQARFFLLRRRSPIPGAGAGDNREVWFLPANPSSVH